MHVHKFRRGLYQEILLKSETKGLKQIQIIYAVFCNLEREVQKDFCRRISSILIIEINNDIRMWFRAQSNYTISRACICFLIIYINYLSFVLLFPSVVTNWHHSCLLLMKLELDLHIKKKNVYIYIGCQTCVIIFYFSCWLLIMHWT